MKIAYVLTTVPHLGECFPTVLICAANITIINAINIQYLLVDVMFAWFASRCLHDRTCYSPNAIKQINLRRKNVKCENRVPVYRESSQ